MRVQDDFVEVPDLTLTLGQAQERFGIDEVTCEAVLDALIDAGVLARIRGGAYVTRRSGGPRCLTSRGLQLYGNNARARDQRGRQSPGHQKRKRPTFSLLGPLGY